MSSIIAPPASICAAVVLSTCSQTGDLQRHDAGEEAAGRDTAADEVRPDEQQNPSEPDGQPRRDPAGERLPVREERLDAGHPEW
jgi:hypothetical protein